MKLSKLPGQNNLEIPKNWNDIKTYKLIEKLGWFNFINQGLPIVNPIAKKINNQLEKIVRELSENQDFLEISLPRIYSNSIMEKSGKMDLFADEIITLGNGLEKYSLSATTEEIFIEYLKQDNISYRQLPTKLFKIQDAFRNVKRTKGIIKSIQFSGCDFMSLNQDIGDYLSSLNEFKLIMEEYFKLLNLKYIVDVSSDSTKIEYFFEDSEGEKLGSSSIIGIESKLKETDKYSSLAMGYSVTPNKEQNLKFKDSNNNLINPVIGSFGVGLQKIFYAIVDQNRDELGINFPSPVRPFEFSIIPIDVNNDEVMHFSEQMYTMIKSRGINVYLDDRDKYLSKKGSLSDFMGVPYKIIIGKNEVLINKPQIKSRGGDIIYTNLESLLEEIKYGN